MNEPAASNAEPKTILILGGGIGGMTAALHVAGAGQRALVVDDAPAIGGSLPLLDKTFPTDSCAVCFAAPEFPAICPFFECESSPLIDIRTHTTLDWLHGEPGDFTAGLTTRPGYVDPERCTSCGLCAEICPQSSGKNVLHANWPGEIRKAIDRPFPQAVPNTYRIDPIVCTWCGACVDACPQDAIDLDQEPVQESVPAAAVVLAPGFSPADARMRGAYGYGEYANVLTSLEYERMISTSSPSKGLPVRPDDGAPARRIAFIHCVGSRDPGCGQPYCSASCCMIAAKQASLTVRRAPGVSVSLFTMDVRAAGRGYERYMAKVRAHPGITYHRSLVSGIKPDPAERTLQLQYFDGRRAQVDDFDLVVLLVGMVVPPDVRHLAGRIGVQLNRDGFAETDDVSPVETSRPGVFVAGAFREPKDLTATVAEAAAAAAGALQCAGTRLKPEPAGPPESSPERSFYDAARIGIALDTGDPELERTVDLAALARAAARFPGVVQVGPDTDAGRLCGFAGEHALTHLVAGVHAARRSEQRPERLSGVPVSWVGLAGADLQTAAARLEMAVAQARSAGAAPIRSILPERRAVVIGAGAAGLAAARTLGALGIETHLVERESGLGGWLLRHSAEPGDWLETWIEEVESHPALRVHLGGRITGMRGGPGCRFFEITSPAGVEEIPAGAFIVAAGARSHRPAGFGLDRSPAVLTQPEFGRMIAGWRNEGSMPEDLGLVVMLQCAGSRVPDRSYCSRTCCIEALRNAAAVRTLSPNTRVAILFRDIVTPGFSEALYTEARRLGVLFIRHQAQELRPDGGQITVLDDVLQEEITLQPDWLVLSSGITPDPDTGRLAEILGLPLTKDGFFEAAHPKTRPFDLPAPGGFLAGLAGGPATLDESIEQGAAAGLRAALFINRQMRTPAALAVVDERLCSGCGLCVAACPAGARALDPDLGTAQVDPWLCTGCGSCAAVCPNGASRQTLFEAGALLNGLDAALFGQQAEALTGPPESVR